MTCAIVATARNEGPFIVEWLAHHFAVGFDRIFVATNNCEDASDLLLDRLSAQWPVWRINNDNPLDSLTFQRSGVRRCLAHPEFSEVTWALHIDLDEFLCLAPPVSSVGNLLARVGEPDALLLCWRLFGDDGRRVWSGGSTLDSFLSCESHSTTGIHKVLWRTASFSDVSPHCPKEPLRPLDDLVVVTTAGTRLDPWASAQTRGTTLPVPEDEVTWHLASISHYMHKSTDLALLGRDFRGDANGRRARAKRTPGHPEFEKYNRNECQDRTIQAFRPSRIAIENRMLSDPLVLQAHHMSLAWFRQHLLDRVLKDPKERVADNPPSHPPQNSL